MRSPSTRSRKLSNTRNRSTENLVDAQQARRVLDRLVGYKVSPLLWRTIGGKLSAGRVQTVAVRMVVEREREIEAFVKTEYWTIVANLAAKLPPNSMRAFIRSKTKRSRPADLTRTSKPARFTSRTTNRRRRSSPKPKSRTFIVDSVTTKERKRNPTPPFITSKLQQEAARKLGFPVKKTMMIAQKLYEGVEIGAEGAVGLITYMRTDSTRVSDAALGEVRDFIGGAIRRELPAGKAELLPIEERCAGCARSDPPDRCQRARPTALQASLKPEELKLYRLIWQRFVASQMMPGDLRSDDDRYQGRTLYVSRDGFGAEV